ncbi:MAG: serine/threonine protein kinase, partial [Streptomyces sp.]
LLMPDPDPAMVPGTAGAADPTQVLPNNAGSYDPNAATSVMQNTGSGDADPTSVLPGGSRGAADPTAVMPPVPPNQPGYDPNDPHPWQNQMRAARDRNEQTQVQSYLDPNDDPLRRRRPQRQVQQPQQQQRPQQYAPQQQRQQPQQRQQYAPQPQQQQYAPPQQTPPQQPPAGRPPREPRQPRQRSSNPMKIPGLGCLKGCLFTLIILFVASWLVWELSPLQEWIGTTKGYWAQLGEWYDTVSGWMGKVSGN